MITRRDPVAMNLPRPGKVSDNPNGAARIHVSRVVVGEVELDPAAAHHARNVLAWRMARRVEVFDGEGELAAATLVFRGTAGAAVRIEAVYSPAPRGPRLVIASAIPKGDRADWMVEKLSEIGVAEFIPLAAARSIVLPEGKGKRERWIRLATEAARQSRRVGVMSIAPLTSVFDAIRATRNGGYFSPDPKALSLPSVSFEVPADQEITFFIGPEGGWTDDEAQMFADAKIIPYRLTHTILRIETAAILGAGIFLSSVNCSNCSMTE